MMKESDIRNDKSLKEYQKLVDQDSKKLLKKKKYFKNINLKKLGLGKMNFAFSKKGYDYLECLSTGSLIANPRPSRSCKASEIFNNLRTDFSPYSVG